MFNGIRVLMIGASIMILLQTERPAVCAGIYAGAHMFFALMLGASWLVILVGGAIAFGLTFLYFWLLCCIDHGSALWWLVLIMGLAIGLV